MANSDQIRYFSPYLHQTLWVVFDSFVDYTSPLVRAISVRGTIRNKNQISTSPGFNELYESLIHAIENPPDNKFDDNWLKTTTEDCIVRAEICLENLAKELHLAQNSCTASSIV